MRRLAILALVLVAATAVNPMRGGAADPPLRQRATSEQLGGSERNLTYLSTDKPIYREGETVRVRGVVLNAATHAPLAQGGAWGTIEVHGPKGDTIARSGVQSQASVFAFSWVVPDGTPGGEYAVRATLQGEAPAERKFEVRAYRAPRLNSQIVFGRDGYGPGDAVDAKLHVERAEGGVPAGAKVTAIARVDGAEVYNGAAKVAPDGNVLVTFPLPEHIERGEGDLAFVIQDGGVVESATKTIPILVNSVDVALYPEGGELVAGLPCRVYVEARTPSRKPADLEGQLVDAAGKVAASVRTEHEGRGRFTFTPEAGVAYRLRIDKPTGIKRTFPLPRVQSRGAVITTARDVSPAGEPVVVQVGQSGVGAVTVTVSQREIELAATTLQPGKGRLFEVSLPVPDDVSGVLIATAWDHEGRPLAERLVFRQPGKGLRVHLEPKQQSYTPGQQVELTVKTTDERGKPVGATVGLAATDESVLEMIEKREQAPRLPVMVLLESEVREIADAHVYLDPDNAKAPLAVDLLLGTQGWRRFAVTNWQEFLSKQGEAGRRALAQRLAPQAPVAAGFPGGEGMKRKSAGMPRAAEPMADEAPMAAPPPMAAAVPAAPPAMAPGPVPVPRPQRMENELAAEPAPAPRAGGAKRQLWGGAAGQVAMRRPGPRMPPAVWVREYVHEARPAVSRDQRTDFTETVYWSAGIATDPQTGEATVRFGLSDAVTSFRVLADAFDARGALGAGTATITAVEPFYAEPKLPLEVTTGDVIELPVAVVNGTDLDMRDGAIAVRTVEPIGVTGDGPMRFAPQSRSRRLVKLEVGRVAGRADVTIDAKGGPLSDTVKRSMVVKPAGFPIEVAGGGILEPGKPSAFTLDVAADVLPGSITADITAFPAPLGSLTQALERMMVEPNGCFEQTSSTNYPLVMAQQYFLTHSGVDPSVIERSRGLLKRGYDRLRGFECKKNGYEWFGEDPGHEALSAFGLMEFRDMSRVMQVDMGMVDRTRAWVMSRRDGKGGFTHQRRALHTWLTDEDVHNGYITWALLESGETQIGEEARSFREAAKRSKNSYVVALGANVALKSGDRSTARMLMSKLASLQTAEGSVDGSTMSIVGSSGDALAIETTALAALAWLQDPGHAGEVEKAVRYLSGACKGGRYGSTQSTVLALRAILAYDKVRAGVRKPGAVQVLVDGKPAGAPTPFGADTQEALKLADVAGKLGPGRHELSLALVGGGRLPYTVAVRYNALTPSSSQATKVSLETTLRDARLAEGTGTEIAVTMRNLSAATVPMSVAIIGVPGGLEVRHDQLKELKKQGRIAFYEVLGRDVVLYWRELEGNATVQLPISLVAAVPGTYTGPASRAYLYYGDEHKRWVPGLRVEIRPR